MATLNDIPRTYEDAVKNLAAWHTDKGVEIYYSPDPHSEVVKLVEVSDAFGDDDTLRPIPMGASGDFPFKSRLLLVSAADWERVQKGNKTLPEGWELDRLVPLIEHD